MNPQPRKSAPPVVTLIIGFVTFASFLGVCADSTTRTAFAHGIINAFGIEYDNSSSGLVALDVQTAIDEQEATNADLEARVATLESGGLNPCDPNGDGVITAQELKEYFTSIGYPGIPINLIQSWIGQAESNSGANQINGVLDVNVEVAMFNVTHLYLTPGEPICPTL